LDKIFEAKEPKSALVADILTEELKMNLYWSIRSLLPDLSPPFQFKDRRLKLKQLENFVTSTKGYWENYINLITGGYPDPK